MRTAISPQFFHCFCFWHFSLDLFLWFSVGLLIFKLIWSLSQFVLPLWPKNLYLRRALCVMCLWEAHDASFCCLCQQFTLEAMVDKASWLKAALWECTPLSSDKWATKFSASFEPILRAESIALPTWVPTTDLHCHWSLNPKLCKAHYTCSEPPTKKAHLMTKHISKASVLSYS